MRYKLPLAALLAAVVAWRWRARAPPPDLTELEAGARVGWVAAFDADTSGALSPDELARLKASMDLDLDGIELMIEHLLREHTHNVMRAVNLKLSAPGTLRAINRHTRALFVVDRLGLTLTDIATSAKGSRDLVSAKGGGTPRFRRNFSARVENFFETFAAPASPTSASETSKKVFWLPPRRFDNTHVCARHRPTSTELSPPVRSPTPWRKNRNPCPRAR